MLQNKREWTFAVSFISGLALILAVPPPYRLNCDIQVRCSFEPPLAWVTDGQNCKVFYNSCLLRNYNCQRQENGLPLLTDTTQEKCLQYCRSGCTKELNPVCTDRNGTSVTLQNHCLWAQEMCKTGQAYIFQFEGNCPKSTE